MRKSVGVLWRFFAEGQPSEEVEKIGVSMGPIVARDKERLVPADAAVVRLRQRLLESARRHEAGQDPFGLNIADYSKARSLTDTNVAAGDRWQDLLPSNMSLASKKRELSPA